MHNPIIIKNFTSSFPQKQYFENFSTTIYYGDRIVIIGRNGSGKSTLLKMIYETNDNINIGYVPQIINEFDNLSGGERFNMVLTKALSHHPNILLLDEPTNHLDQYNRKSLLKMLDRYPGTLIIASHDMDLMKGILWHIDNESIHIFHGSYKSYKHELYIKKETLTLELAKLNQEKKDTHQALMKEQKRASKSSKQGAKKRAEGKWPTLVAGAKERQAQSTTAKNKSQIKHQKQMLVDQLSELRMPEIIKPKFSLQSSENGTYVLIVGGNIGYTPHQPIIKNIHLSLGKNERLAIIGNNGSGKSTLIKAILNDPSVIKSGEWITPKQEDIGYLDQHYKNLAPHKTVLESIDGVEDIRKHLNSFLFRTNEEVNARVSTLSGGEKARLSLAQIAAHNPKLLILDEITNNLDLETKEHIIQILKEYKGTLIVISHEEAFLKEIDVTQYFHLQ